jgi:hypothetical protein
VKSLPLTITASWAKVNHEIRTMRYEIREDAYRLRTSRTVSTNVAGSSGFANSGVTSLR